MKFNDSTIESAIVEKLKQLHLTVVSSKFIPLGEESYGYKIITDNQKLFVKYSRDKAFAEKAERVNQLLLELKHFDFVVPPIVIEGKTVFDISAGNFVIFPYLEGNVVDIGNDKFDKELISKLTKITSQIHTETKNITIDLPRETFEDVFSQQFEHLTTQLNNSTAQDVQDLFIKNEAVMSDLIHKYIILGRKYKSSPPPFILTHGDITGLNIIQNEDGLKLVDWDGAMFAPKERDLNFLVSNPHFKLDEYLELTGQNTYDPELKEYYSLRWSLETILGNFESLLRNGKAKASREEYMEEIRQYLQDY